MKLGPKQLELLILASSVTSVLLSTDKVSASLVKRGLLRERDAGKACCIAPAGLRLLADEMEAGRVDDALEAIRKQVEARRAKTAALKADQSTSQERS